MTAPLKLGHIHIYVYNTRLARPTSSKMKIPQPQINLDRNPPATNILQNQNQPRNPFVERNSVKYEPSWLVIPVISAILCCGFGGGDSLLIVDLDLELLFSYNIVIKIV